MAAGKGRVMAYEIHLTKIDGEYTLFCDEECKARIASTAETADKIAAALNAGEALVAAVKSEDREQDNTCEIHFPSDIRLADAARRIAAELEGQDGN